MNKRADFSLYQKEVGNRRMWYARYWSEEKHKYYLVRSTGVEVRGKRQRQRQAYEAARTMLNDLCMNANKTQLVIYLTNFWKPNSNYAKEKALELGHPLSRGYFDNAKSFINKHIKSYAGFDGLRIGDVKYRHIKDFITYMSETGCSGTRINRGMLFIRVALNYALQREEIAHNPFEKIKPVKISSAEKGILTNAELQNIIMSSAIKPRRRLAIMLGCLCGMRAEEVLGLM